MTIHSMKKNKKNRGIFQVCLLLFLMALQPLQGIIDIGELSREGKERVVAVEIMSSSSQIKDLAKRAFALHGGYEVVKEKGDFVFQLEEMPKGVEVTIESGEPRQVIYQGQIEAKDWQAAVCRACDVMVEKTLGIPGFFEGALVFVGEREGHKELYVSDILFQSVRQLTHDRSKVVAPRWSPDGNKILYTSYKSGFPDIYLINLSTGQRRLFAGYEGTNAGGAFSPSGDRVAMILSSSGNPELYIANADGGRPKRMTQNKYLEASPCWSPDGESIYLTSDARGGPQVYRFDLSTNAMELVPARLSGYCAEPSVNPRQPDQIAFTAAVNKEFQIGCYNAGDTEGSFLTTTGGSHLEPCWLNDGRHLIVTEAIGNDRRLIILDSLTGKKTALHGKEFGQSSMGSFVMRSGMSL